MSNAKVIFTIDGHDFTVQCLNRDKMREICQKFCAKVEKNINSLIFLYGGNQLNLDLNFENIANPIDKFNNEMKILVYKNAYKEFICPK